jgi:hypothetical protein
MDDAAEHIPAKLVRAQGELPAWREQAFTQILLVNALRCDQICRQGREQQQSDQNQADHRARAPAQARPRTNLFATIGFFF